MKGFKSTGNGPRYGSFKFSSRAGFGPSSGSVRTVSGYTRRAGRRVVKKAAGGLLRDNIVDTPGGPADFAKGGKVGAVKGLAEYISRKKRIDEKNPRSNKPPMNSDRRLEFYQKLNSENPKPNGTPKTGK